ncbi:MAG: hypothetical protein HKN78_06725 [Sphingomonadaceae bacterium]|nr:hypothetical protein [Sphingomonadaceae bacterium]
MRHFLFLSAVIPALLLSACARTETPEEARSNAQEAQAEFDRLAEASRDGEDVIEDIVGAPSPGQIDTSNSAQLTTGSWTIATEDGERMARFGEEGQAPRITIACEVGGGIDVRLIGMEPQGGSETVYFSSPAGGSTFTASAAVGNTQGAYISVPAADQFIGRLIAGSGPFSIRMGSNQRLAFPADDVLTSVVSACDRRTADEVAAGNATASDAAGDSAEASDTQ